MVAASSVEHQWEQFAMRPSSSGWHPGKASTKGTSIGIAINLKKLTCDPFVLQGPA